MSGRDQTHTKKKGGGETSIEHKESFVRWQSITITQLGYVINLVLTLATASLGFSLTLITNENFAPRYFAKLLFILSLILILLSIVFGIACVINRLSDFRKTTQIARDRERLRRDGVADREIDRQLAARRLTTKTLGKVTWRLFWFQIGAFAAGVSSLSIALMIHYSSRLF